MDWKIPSARDGEVRVKENIWRGDDGGGWRLLAAAALTLGALLAAAAVHHALPPPRPATDPPHLFHGLKAHDLLVNLTAIGPRVAGSYENEVAAVALLVEAVKAVQRGAGPHNVVELDLQRSSGAFNLTFFDGMNNVYRDVQSVVVRVRGAGASPAPRARTALLLNAHFDTVPDSPGASDDGAAVAVLLETLRALAASPAPLRHDVIVLLNGAEENIMQASHAFITQHKWAKSVRAFINLEACGAGGREVLFQAGPADPWLVEVYAGVVPHPFASSLAQELFEGGLIPADTDFRVFRDFGRLSGVDLAWTADGYVYHTHLDTAARVPPAVLQRTGDNVLALVHGLQLSGKLESDLFPGARQSVFFDVLGLYVVCARAPAAAAVALGALALLVLRLRADAKHYAKRLYVTTRSWYAALGRALLLLAAAHAAGAAAAAALALLLHAGGARLAFYSTPWLLAPLYALPALGAAALLAAGGARRLRVGAVPARRAVLRRLLASALVLGWGLLLLACLLTRLRSGFVPLLWVALPTLALFAGGGDLCWSAGALLPVLQTWYLALGALQMFVPLMGRAGTPPLPPDLLMALLTASLALSACSWLLPLLADSRRAMVAGGALLATGAVLALLLLLGAGGAAYSGVRPQRYMVFHTRRSDHSASPPQHSDHYWLPHLDANTPHSLAEHVPELASAVFDPSECVRWPYCGAPYSLPVLALVARGYWAPAPAPPPLHLTVQARTQPLNTTTRELVIDIDGDAAQVVVVVSPCVECRVSWSSALQQPPLPAADWGQRRTYFMALHAARAPRSWTLTMHIEHPAHHSPSEWASLSVAGHGVGAARAHAHDALLQRMPRWVAHTGWPVHLHLLRV